MKSDRVKRTLEYLFQKHYRVEGECWVWTGCVTLTGAPHYSMPHRFKAGYYSKSGGTSSARRVSIYISRGEVPQGKLFVTCGNIKCVNPEHITASKSAIAAYNRFSGRNEEMRKMRSAGETLQSIGEKYGVTRQRVQQICARHVDEISS